MTNTAGVLVQELFPQARIDIAHALCKSTLTEADARVRGVDNGLRGEGGNDAQDVIALRQIERQRLSSFELSGMRMIGGIDLKSVSGPDCQMSSEVTTPTGNEQGAFGCHHGCVQARLQSSWPYLFVKTHRRLRQVQSPTMEGLIFCLSILPLHLPSR